MKTSIISLVVFLGLISVSHDLIADVCLGTTVTYPLQQGLGWWRQYTSAVNADGSIPPQSHTGPGNHDSSGIHAGSPVYITTANYGGTFPIHTKASNTCGSSMSPILQVTLPGTGEEGSRKAGDNNDPEQIVDETNKIIVDVPYPIPSRDNININLSQPSSIKIINLQEITVREVSAEGQTIISTDDLSAGIYLLKLQNQTQFRQFRVSIHK